MVLSITGLSSNLALNLIDATKDRQLETMQKEPVHARAESVFRERIGAITTPEELVQDFEVYSFVMRAFDLEDQIFGKGMMRKILESDPDDDTSLVNRLTDSRFTELHEAMGFTTGAGPQVPDFTDEAWVQDIVDRYYQTAFINANDAENETVGTVLHFRDTVAEISTWYDVLKDTDLTQFFQVALGLPSEMSGLDVDKQFEILAEKFDIAKLSDPAELKKLESRYVAISDALNQTASVNNAALSILQNAATSGQFVPVTIDISAISYSSASLYR
ncbi:DUF1217 domain-containing protein [Shimia sp.]|uniref:DUF1217 domain-containing protein n=1 Tax=Shimia sp. TaxID=1954381 RepID=UPI0035647608